MGFYYLRKDLKERKQMINTLVKCDVDIKIENWERRKSIYIFKKKKLQTQVEYKCFQTISISFKTIWK